MQIIQRIFVPIIYIFYITIILFIGRYLHSNSPGIKYYKTIGNLAYVLGLADGIYLIPRLYAILTTGIEDNLRVIGWGRLGNSIVITLFFMILYDAYNIRFNKRYNKKLNMTIYILGFIRMAICLLPGNDWFNSTISSTYAIARIIPLGIMGLLLMLITYLHGKKFKDKNFKLLPIGIFFSILFLEPMALVPDNPNRIFVFIILRTVSMLWIISLGYKELRDKNVLSRY